MVLKVDTFENTIEFSWAAWIWLAIAVFCGSALWRMMLERKRQGKRIKTLDMSLIAHYNLQERIFRDPKVYVPFVSTLFGFMLLFPLLFSDYQTVIWTKALMFIVLGLGLNIVVGLAGLLDLGYVAFYAVGGYSYALLNMHYGLGFWAVLPVAAIMAAITGIMLGVPVLRLRGDYLAIVTLGFGEIIRIVLENWYGLTNGPSGISNIPKPSFFGLDLSYEQNVNYLYYLCLGLTVLTIVVVRRLIASRIGRAWVALREDETACRAMGINTTVTKLTAFGLGATWAGFMGVMFGAVNTFVNPKSFEFMQSAMFLCIVVMGGMGSIPGVIIAALMLSLLPEYLRFLSDYRMLTFGAIMVIMMVFRPQGLISDVRRNYEFKEAEE